MANRGKGRGRGRGRGVSFAGVPDDDDMVSVRSTVSTASRLTTGSVLQPGAPSTSSDPQTSDQPSVPSAPGIMRTVIPLRPPQPRAPPKEIPLIGMMKNNVYTFLDKTSLDVIVSHKNMVQNSISCVDRITRDLKPLSELMWPNPLFDNDELAFVQGMIKRDNVELTTIEATNEKFDEIIRSVKGRVILYNDCISWNVIINNIIQDFVNNPSAINKNVIMANYTNIKRKKINDIFEKLRLANFDFISNNRVIPRLFNDNYDIINAFVLRYIINECKLLDNPLTVYMVIDKNNIGKSTQQIFDTLRENVTELNKQYQSIFKSDASEANLSLLFKLFDWLDKDIQKLRKGFIVDNESADAFKWSEQMLDNNSVDIFKAEFLYKPNDSGKLIKKSINEITFGDPQFKEFLDLHKLVNTQLTDLSKEHKYKYLNALDKRNRSYTSHGFWVASLSKENAMIECLYNQDNCKIEQCVTVEISLPRSASVFYNMTNNGGNVIIPPCSTYNLIKGMENNYMKLEYQSTKKKDNSGENKALFNKMMELLVINKTPLSSKGIKGVGKFVQRGNYALIDTNDYVLMKKYLLCE